MTVPVVPAMARTTLAWFRYTAPTCSVLIVMAMGGGASSKMDNKKKKDKLVIFLTFFSFGAVISTTWLFFLSDSAANFQRYWLSNSINIARFEAEDISLRTIHSNGLTVPVETLREVYNTYYWAKYEAAPPTSTIDTIDSFETYLNATKNATQEIHQKDQEKKSNTEDSLNKEFFAFVSSFTFQVLTVVVSVWLAMRATPPSS